MKKYSKEEAKKEVEKLVEFYNENKSKSEIDETVIRNKFINRFFTYLNWDISNQEMRALNEQYVYEEERIAMNGNKKMPDYTFCDGDGGINNRAFFVEAKPPKANLEKDIDVAFQVRNYGYSARLYISILTNFEQLAIYNTYNIEPINNDQPTKARLRLINCADYVNRFDEIWNLLEFDNVQAGSIRAYVANLGIISDTQKSSKDNITVDESFLMLIEDWRKKLAKEVVLRSQNSFMNTDKEQINYAVQKIIDRIIFLRIIEDRGLEEYGNLRTIAKNYKALCKYFIYADEKYNSGLFHFSKNIDRGIHDTITQKLNILGDTITDIVRDLYNKPYKFDVMPAYILGSVYERFLGKEVVVGSSNSKNELINENVSIDLKPDVRKAGGVFYTPEYIVRYIVENTITANEEATILDPACGSGSFLLVAYQYMLDFYQKKSPNKKLTLQQRKEILLKHIYGVDLDEQAVEVAKLSLLLKVLEGVSKEEIESTRRKNLHALPSLHNNIKCGDSLIDDKTVSEKAFNWEEEFPTVCGILGGRGGFDFVIGNPPYVQFQKDKANSKNYSHYQTYDAGGDIYSIFYEQSMKLLKQNGTLGYITSNKWMRAGYGEKLRLFFTQYNPKILLDFTGIKIFEDATVDCNILIIQKKNNQNNTVACQIDKSIFIPIKLLSKKSKGENTLIEGNKSIKKFVKNNHIVRNFNNSDIWLLKNGKLDGIKEKVKQFGTPLKDWDIKINRGAVTGFNEAFIIDDETRREIIMQDPKSNEIIKPVLRGRDINKYGCNWKHLYMITTFPAMKLNIDDYPAIKEYLLSFGYDRLKQDGAKGSRRKASNKWFETQDSTAFYDEFEKEKIIYSNMTSTPSFFLDNEGFLTNQKCYILTGSHLKYLLAIFNSKFFHYYFWDNFPALGLKGRELNKMCFVELPIPIPNKRTENQFIKLVDQLLKAKSQDKRTEPFEWQIDELVYELYGLTEAEIRTVEGKQ